MKKVWILLVVFYLLVVAQFAYANFAIAPRAASAKFLGVTYCRSSDTRCLYCQGRSASNDTACRAVGHARGFPFLYQDTYSDGSSGAFFSTRAVLWNSYYILALTGVFVVVLIAVRKKY